MRYYQYLLGCDKSEMSYYCIWHAPYWYCMCFLSLFRIREGISSLINYCIMKGEIIQIQNHRDNFYHHSLRKKREFSILILKVLSLFF